MEINIQYGNNPQDITTQKWDIGFVGAGIDEAISQKHF